MFSIETFSIAIKFPSKKERARSKVNSVKNCDSYSDKKVTSGKQGKVDSIISEERGEITFTFIVFYFTKLFVKIMEFITRKKFPISQYNIYKTFLLSYKNLFLLIFIRA